MGSFHVEVMFVSLLAVLLLIVWNTVTNALNIFRTVPNRRAFAEISSLSFGAFLALILLGEAMRSDWNVALRLGGGEIFRVHSPIASWHALTLGIMLALALVGLATLRAGRQNLPPLLAVLSLACVYLGCLVSVLWIIQLVGPMISGDVFWPEIAVLAVFPVNLLLIVGRLLLDLVRDETLPRQEDSPQPGVKGWLAARLRHAQSLPLAALILLLPVYGLIVMVLLLVGQRPDAMLAAFLETSDWTLSQETSPATIFYDGHYLCTVAAGGHPRIVKPLRKGVRHGHEIIVNRQLLIANAFEDVIAERTPRFHRWIRGVYDAYGFPIASLIRNRTTADAVYMAMKPLELFFVGILYLVDRDPENRIMRQYAPGAPTRGQDQAKG